MRKPSRATRTPAASERSAYLASRRVAGTFSTVAGIVGSALCSFAMVAAALGLFAAAGATAARSSSMTGMGGMAATARRAPGWLQALVRFGPQILVVSLVLVALGVGIRKRSALPLVALGGAVLYAGMYVQSSLAWMYVAIGLGSAVLVFAYALTLRRKRA